MAAPSGNVHLLLVLLGEHHAAPAAVGGRALSKVRDHVVEGSTHARDELAVRRAVEAAERIPAGGGEGDLLPLLAEGGVVGGLVVQLVEVAARVAETVEAGHTGAVNREGLRGGRHGRGEEWVMGEMMT